MILLNYIGDLPWQVKVYGNLGHAALLACFWCPIRGFKPPDGATKAAGYASHVQDAQMDKAAPELGHASHCALMCQGLGMHTRAVLHDVHNGAGRDVISGRPR